MKRTAWVVTSSAALAYDAYLLGWRLPDVQGNLEAAIIWATPALVVSHVLHRRHADRQHAELHARLDAQDRALNIGQGDNTD